MVAGPTSVRARRDAGLETVERSDVATGAHPVAGRLGNSAPTGPGTLLWAEAASAGWHASAGGRDLTRSTAFDWTNAFALPAHASTALHYRAGSLPGLLIDLEIVAWIGAIVLWRKTRARRDRRAATVSS